MHQHVSVDTLVTQIETYLKSKNLPYAVSDDNDPSTIKTNILDVHLQKRMVGALYVCLPGGLLR